MPLTYDAVQDYACYSMDRNSETKASSYQTNDGIHWHTKIMESVREGRSRNHEFDKSATFVMEQTVSQFGDPGRVRGLPSFYLTGSLATRFEMHMLQQTEIPQVHT